MRLRNALLATLAVLMLGGGVRLLVMEHTFPIQRRGDEFSYTKTAFNLAQGQGHLTGAMRAAWPPGHSFWLSLFVRLEDGKLPPALERLHSLARAQVLMGTLLVAATIALGAALFDVRVGLVAGLIAALYPTFVATSHYFWSETTFAVLLCAALAGAARVERTRSGPLAGATGLAFGAAALTREIALPFAAVCAAWWVVTAPAGRRRGAAGRAALLLAGTLLVVAPWTLRNHALFGRLVPVSTIGWMGMAEGNTLAGDWLRPDTRALRRFRARYFRVGDEMERMDFARSWALERIRAEQPVWIAKKWMRNTALLFAPDSILFYKLRTGAYGDPSPRTLRPVLVAAVLSYVAVVVAGVLGIAGAKGRSALPVGLFGVLLAVHVVANANSRYRVPLLPLLMVYAAYACLRGRALRSQLTRGRLAAALGVLGVFLLWCVPYFHRDAVRLWSLGAPVAAHPTKPGRIVLVSMDTVRADYVSGYAPVETTPVVREIAEQGVLFRRFYAAASYTLPAHMSIFTGLDAAEHGVTRDVARIAPEVTTLAQALSGAGYRTQAFHEGTFVAARFGFDRGFDEYRGHRRLDVATRALPDVLDWMRRAKDQPYFLFVHTYAAHFPYGGFERYRREHPERGLPDEAELQQLSQQYPAQGGPEPPAETRRLCTLYNQLASRHARLLMGCGSDEPGEDFVRSPHFASDLAAIRRSYRLRLRLVDRMIASLRAQLRELDQWDDTLFILTSDHGEAFFEHGLYRHEYVPFEEVMRVPLVLSYPRLLGDAGGREVPGLAWHLDLMPTLLSLAGAESPGGLRGVDLTPVLEGRASLPGDRAIFPAVLRPAHRPQLPLRRIAIREGVKRIEGHESFGDAEGLLFDLLLDPRERRNLRPSEPARFDALGAATRAWEAGLVPHAPRHQATGEPLPESPEAPVAPVELSESELEELRALGYVE